MRSEAELQGRESDRRFEHGDQRRIRPTEPVRDLSEFLAFLGELEDLFGPTVKPRRLGYGTRFLL